jgi:hypothetical protein
MGEAEVQDLVKKAVEEATGSLKTDYEAKLKKLREENASRRVSEKELVEKITSAFGIKVDDDAASKKDAVLEELVKEAKANRRFRAEQALEPIAKKVGLDHRAAARMLGEKIADMDSAQLEESAKSLLEEFPNLKASSSPGRIGIPPTPGENPKPSMNDIIRGAAGRPPAEQ